MKYENKKNGKIGEFVRSEKGLVNLNVDGKMVQTTESTFKRWWKKVEIPELESGTVEANEVKKPNLKEKKEKIEKKRDHSIDYDSILNHIFEKTRDLGGEIFIPSKDIKMRGLKIGGHLFAKINYSCKNVTIGCRSKAVSVSPDKTVKHLFDNLYIFTDLEEDKELIDKLLTESVEYQISVNKKKEEKENGKN